MFDLIRGSANLRDVPVLSLTSAPDRAEHAHAQGGISDVMRKPFDIDALTARVGILLGRAETVA